MNIWKWVHDVNSSSLPRIIIKASYKRTEYCCYVQVARITAHGSIEFFHLLPAVYENYPASQEYPVSCCRELHFLQSAIASVPRRQTIRGLIITGMKSYISTEGSFNFDISHGREFIFGYCITRLNYDDICCEETSLESW
jgi:hypothetical protein